MSADASGAHVLAPVPVQQASPRKFLGELAIDAHSIFNVLITVMLWVGLQGLFDTVARDELSAKVTRYALYGTITACTVLIVMILGWFGANPLISAIPV